MAGDIHDVTKLSSLSLHNTLQVGAASLTTASGLALSGSALNIGTGTVSWNTIAAHSSLASQAGLGMQVGVIFRASGLSLLFRSGNSIYYLNSDASGAA